MTPLPDRRSVLAGLASSLLPGSALALLGIRPARAAPLRVAAIDWGMLETVLALGVAPVAATELLQFRAIAIEPAVPGSVADIGLRGTPNYELLRITAPDLILISPFYERQRARLERIAPVLSLPIFLSGVPPYALAEAAMTELGARLGREEAARSCIARTADRIAGLRGKLTHVRRPVFVINLGDSRHLRAFGDDSIFGDVLVRLGLENAWRDRTSYSAAAPVGLEALARVPEAIIALIAPLPLDAGRGLPDNALWNALPAAQNGRVITLAPINHFGGLPAADRFARLFAEGLSRLKEGALG